MSYLLRLVVPDRPGSLGAVATALGVVGVDILSVEVLERGNGYAVDDIVVELPEDRLADSLITAALTVPGVQVESLRPFSGPLDTHRELELLDELARAGRQGAHLLAEMLPRVHHAGWAVVLRCTEPDDVTVLAAHPAAPSLTELAMPWLPLGAPLLLPSEGEWLPERWREMAIEMMAAPVDARGTAVLLGRSGGPAFRRSELLRLAHLAGLAATVAELPPV
ncbi:amino acid-binding protein [Modestobacter sp. I12A-02628]|uniref:Amino acid-binding protein n=1 Tax=Goekera deserti TaxID=2497753 RepID=A0A7K3WJK4_9ACTN|nr:amino acid-binding protein [Goekera deserti]MPQ97342.1 amino acid-binding protein [Goekera deserti]NDI50145.1 amino acid-binding protein [Goekera deserti]NEL55713.1 amino acid-binding protein [Goekera deserti]